MLKGSVIYAHLEGRPVVITDLAKATGYWLVNDKWVKMHPADVTQAGALSKEDFDKTFPNLPPYL